MRMLWVMLTGTMVTSSITFNQQRWILSVTLLTLRCVSLKDSRHVSTVWGLMVMTAFMRMLFVVSCVQNQATSSLRKHSSVLHVSLLQWDTSTQRQSTQYQNQTMRTVLWISTITSSRSQTTRLSFHLVGVRRVLLVVSVWSWITSLWQTSSVETVSIVVSCLSVMVRHSHWVHRPTVLTTSHTMHSTQPTGWEVSVLSSSAWVCHIQSRLTYQATIITVVTWITITTIVTVMVTTITIATRTIMTQTSMWNSWVSMLVGVSVLAGLMTISPCLSSFSTSVICCVTGNTLLCRMVQQTTWTLTLRLIVRQQTTNSSHVVVLTSRYHWRLLRLGLSGIIRTMLTWQPTVTLQPSRRSSRRSIVG